MNLFGNYSFGFIFVAIAVVHFIRRRPDNYWLWIILMGGGIGALIYIAAEVVPDLGLLRHSFQIFSHRKRIAQLEVMVLDNPSAGNYEELADLYLEQKKFAKAKECYDHAISPQFRQFTRTLGWWANGVSRQGNALYLSSGYWGVQKIDLQ
ncbi:MAG TPA: hypothetical protein VLA83_17660 [Candidatus Binatia bacterium]|nr:hypothetical protein [Candidatus Binatia bacterium]